MNKQHEKILYLFSTALDAGDFETISQIWDAALNDDELSAKLVEFGLETNDEEMRMLSQSNGKLQPISQPRITPIAMKPYAQKRRLTRVAIILFGIILVGVFAYATFYADDPVHTTIIEAGDTPTPTPFKNPIEPTLSYTTHDPILENGKGVLSFQYPDTFSVTEDDENGIQLWSEVFGTWIKIVPPGDIRIDPETSINQGESFDDFVQRVIEETDSENTIIKYTIENIKVAEIKTQTDEQSFFSSAVSWLLDTPEGPLFITSIGLNPYSQLSRDIAYEMLPTVQFDAEASPLPIDYSDLTDRAAKIELELNTPLTANFTPEERGLVYSFEASQDEIFIVSASMPLDDSVISSREYIYFYLLDEGGQVIAEVKGNTHSDEALTEAVIIIPEEGFYQLLMMLGENENMTMTPVGGSFTVVYHSVTDLQPDVIQQGQIQTDDDIVATWFISDAKLTDKLNIIFELSEDQYASLSTFLYSVSEQPMINLEINDSTGYLLYPDYKISTKTFDQTGDYIVILKHRPPTSNDDTTFYPFDYQIELVSESIENE